MEIATVRELCYGAKQTVKLEVRVCSIQLNTSHSR